MGTEKEGTNAQGHTDLQEEDRQNFYFECPNQGVCDGRGMLHIWRNGNIYKAETTSLFIDIIHALWFVHYLKFCKVVINNEEVQFLGSSRFKILRFAGCNHDITTGKKNSLTKHDQPLLFSSQMDLECCFSHSM